MVFPYPQTILGPTECMSGRYTEFTHKELLLITLCYYSVVCLQLFKMSTVLVVACDDGIGRCGKSTLSQQSLMELFIFGIHQAEKISGSRECPEEVCNWEGVTCNADGEVEMLFWSCEWEYGTGTLGLAFLPCSMKNLRMTENALSEGGDGGVASAGLRAQRHNIDPRSRRLAGHRPDGWPSLDGGSV